MAQETRPERPHEPSSSLVSPARIEALEASLSALQDELAVLRALVIPPAADVDPGADDVAAARSADGVLEPLDRLVSTPEASSVVFEDYRPTRRALLGRAGMVAAGTAAGLVAVGASSTPAAALPGSPTVSPNPAWARYSGGAAGPGFLFEAGTEISAGENPFEKAALAGAATGGASFLPTTGIFGYSSVAGGTGVEARAESGDGAALVARSLAGPTLRLRSGASAPSVMPPHSGTWQVGDVLRTADAHIWYCKLAGVAAASRWSRLSEVGLTIRPTPYRAYDSRLVDGPFTFGTTRLVSLVVAAGTIPAGSVGVLLNVTATNTISGGYVQVYSGSLATAPETSNLNWYTDGQTVANSVTSAVSGDRKVKVTTGGPPNSGTDVIIDVFGFYA